MDGRPGTSLGQPVQGSAFVSSPRCCWRAGTAPYPLACSQGPAELLAHSRSSRCMPSGRPTVLAGGPVRCLDAQDWCPPALTVSGPLPLVLRASDSSLPGDAPLKISLRLLLLLNVSLAAAGPEAHLPQLVCTTREGQATWRLHTNSFQACLRPG